VGNTVGDEYVLIILHYDKALIKKQGRKYGSKKQVKFRE